MRRYDVRELAAIFLGGAVGALLRAGLVQWQAPRLGHWPWVTFGVNVAGAFALGYFVTRLQERLPLSAYRRPLLGTGFCGALTTFSSVVVTADRLFAHDRVGTALAYLSATIAGGLAAAVLGLLLGRALSAGRPRERVREGSSP